MRLHINYYIQNATNLSHQRSIVQETMVEFCIKSNKSGDTLDLLHAYWANIVSVAPSRDLARPLRHDLWTSYPPPYVY